MKQENRLSINWYIEKTIELLEISPLENQFQDFIVYPILDSIIKSETIQELDLIDCHNFRQFNTECHNRCKYSVLVKAVPDMIIAKDFFYYNRNEQVYNALKMVASIEVKEPNNSWMLDKYVKSIKEQEEYDDRLYLELVPSLFKNRKTILTNIRKWEFFDVTNVTDLDLGEQIKLYVKILELCGFDATTDYQWGADGKKSRKRVLKKDVINTRWNELKEIGALKEKIETIDEALEKKHFDEIVNFVDEKYMNAIKTYIQSAHIQTVDIITSKGQLMVNQCFSENLDGAGISSVSDLNYDCLKWDQLLKEIREFVKIYEM